ncbi:KAP family P-loop NTPase fold protein [Methanosarcina mazei]|uniref:KAP NTPase domain-containing protein n=1 Tax=Methanosarcina mazei SarPi TaxID=1434115 RepID=A0A0E3RAV9_METMZ|nr:P-loop NTPase fold protein [Methanosarcina mazei]AKB61423.1 hypothetical protein MSMAP_1438 [Methanosarcina mazei SarPi]
MPDSKLKLILECWNDVSTEEDSLGFRPYVEAIAEFLTADGTRPPITLSIEGQWGCGKSSFMRQLQKEINKKNKAEEKPEYFTVWFNCWRYEKEDELWAAFALCLMQQLSDHLSRKQRLLAQLKLRRLRLKFKWKDNFILAIFIFICSILSLVNIYFNSINKLSVIVWATLAGIIGPIFYHWKDIKDVVGNPFDFSKLISSPNYTEHISFIEYFHSDFSKIIESYAGDSRVYVFIDDLDRCEIPKAAELMQAINLMISDEAKIHFCIGMDRKIISAGLAAKNEQILKHLNIDGPEHNIGLEYGYDFIEKFIQLPFKVPSPKSADFLTFLTLLEENESSLPPSESVDINGTSEGLPTDDSSEMNILNDMDCTNDSGISKLIFKMVAPVLDNNPRRIKQFINQFRFQKIIGFKIGLFSYKEGTHSKYMWNCKKLAKFVAISMKWPDIVSSLSSDPTLLNQLQQYSLMDTKTKKEDNNLVMNLECREHWINNKKLIELLRVGCVKDGEFPLNIDEYSLSNLDFTKLLQISPIATPNWRDIHGTINDAVMAEATRKMIWERILEVKKVGYENCFCGTPIRNGYLMSYDHTGGYKVPGYAAPQWFYVHCTKCGYDTNIAKCGIKIDDLNKQWG